MMRRKKSVHDTLYEGKTSLDMRFCLHIMSMNNNSLLLY